MTKVLSEPLPNGRHVLLLDLLGFSDLVKSRGVEEVYDVIKECLRTFRRWEERNGNRFGVLYFSDTFILAPIYLTQRRGRSTLPL